MSTTPFNQNTLIDLTNINPNKILEFSFNYELLKYVLTALINNQQNLNGEISKLKLALLEQQKNTGELESELVELKMQKIESPEELDKLYNKKKELESKNQQINDQFENYIQQNKDQIPQKEMQIYTMKKRNKQIKSESSEQGFESEMSNKNNETEKTNDKENKDKTEIKPKPKEKNQEVPLGDFVTKDIIDDINKKIELVFPDITNIKSTIQILQKDLSTLRNNTTEQTKDNMEKIVPQMIEEAFNNKIVTVKKNINNDIETVKESIKNIDKNTQNKILKINEETKKLEALFTDKYQKDFDEIKNNYEKIKNSLSLNSEKLSNTVTPLAFANSRRELEQKIEVEKKFLTIEILDLKNVASSLKNQLIDHLNDTRDRDNISNIMRLIESIQGNIKNLIEFKKMTEEKERRKAIIDNAKFVKPETFNEAINNLKKMIENNKKEFSEIRFDMANIRENDLTNKASFKDLKNLEDTIFDRMDKLKDIVKDNFVEKKMLVKNLKYIEMQTKHLIDESKKVEKQDNWLLAKKPINAHLCASCEAYLGDLKPITNSNFVMWNKYPQKNKDDLEKKILRIDAGFSKVLQMVNQDGINQKDKSNSANISKEERNSSSAGKNDKRKIPHLNRGKKEYQLAPSKSVAGIDEFEIRKSLPKILVKSQNRLNGNLSTQNKNYNTIRTSSKNMDIIKKDEFYENLKDEGEIEQINNENPKIVKIYKKRGYNEEIKE